MADKPETVRGCGSRRALDGFVWAAKPPCVKVVQWDILKLFHQGAMYKEIAKQLDISPQAVAQNVRATIERAHSYQHKDHTLFCQVCRKVNG